MSQINDSLLFSPFDMLVVPRLSKWTLQLGLSKWYQVIMCENRLLLVSGLANRLNQMLAGENKTKMQIRIHVLFAGRKYP